MSILELEQPAEVAEAWFRDFQRAADSGDPLAFRDLFLADSHWRDLIALTGSIETFGGSGAVSKRLAETTRAEAPVTFRIDPACPEPRDVTRVGTAVIEAFFLFETRTGRGRGIARLRPDPQRASAYRAWTLLTALDEWKGHEERVGPRRPTGQSRARDFRGPNWLDDRRRRTAFADREPAALVVGAGQAGLAIAARLAHLGVDTLVVDRHERVGDNWRHRYHALTLHNQVQVNHMPYMPFPPGWPSYIPKDKLANWLESYAEAMELNVWTGTTMTGGRYDRGTGRWTARLRTGDGAERTVRPRHIVMANGVSAIPSVPDLPGLDEFAGLVQHSSEYRDGEDWAGKHAIVVGTGNSGHDIAQDLCQSGALVTMVQRSPTLIVNIEPSAQLPYALYDGGDPLETSDLIAASMPLPLVREAHKRYTQTARQLDADLLAGLEAVGFRVDFGEDDTGWQFKYLTRGGGYYFNVGCSDLIAEGRIGLVQHADIERFGPDGAQRRDGDLVRADLVVLATGYKGQEHLVASLFGDDVADRVGPIWGFGDGLELRAMYTRTGQPGLWFIAGSLAQCRIYSKYLALQIKGYEEGLPRTGGGAT